MSVIKPTLCVGCCLRSISSLSLTVLTWQLVLLVLLVQRLDIFYLINSGSFELFVRFNVTRRLLPVIVSPEPFVEFVVCPTIRNPSYVG